MTASSSASPPADDTGSRQRIVRAAAALFAERGYHGTGIADLEQATGLGRGALYYHIGNKEALLFEISTHYLRLLIAAGHALLARPQDAESRLRAYSAQVMRTIADRQAELTVCFREAHAVTGDNRAILQALHRDYEHVWRDLLQAGVDDGVFERADALAVKALLGVHHYSYLWLRPDGRSTPEDIARYFCDLLLPGLKRPTT